MSSTSLNIPTLLTSDQTAEILKISPRTLERMRIEGSGPRFMKAGRGKRSRVLYRLVDIESWLDANAYHSTAEFSR